MTFKTLADGAEATLAKVQFWQDHPGELSGVATGLAAFDNATGGLEATDLIVLGGRPGMGKSALALNIAARIAKRECTDGEAVLFVSTEMPADLVRRRLASMLSGVSDHALRVGNGRKEDYERFRQQLQGVAKMRLRVADVPGMWTESDRDKYDPATVGGGVRRLIRDGLKPRLLVVDHLSRMGDNPTEAANYRVGRIARNLKNLAMEVGCPVLALSQLNRQVEQRDDKRPQLSDLRDSGEVEAEADLVLLMYRQDYYYQPDQQQYDRRLAGKCLVEVAKARSGPTGTFTLDFDGQTQLFS